MNLGFSFLVKCRNERFISALLLHTKTHRPTPIETQTASSLRSTFSKTEMNTSRLRNWSHLFQKAQTPLRRSSRLQAQTFVTCHRPLPLYHHSACSFCFSVFHCFSQLKMLLNFISLFVTPDDSFQLAWYLMLDCFLLGEQDFQNEAI
jgi:hypothetical protein